MCGCFRYSSINGVCQGPETCYARCNACTGSTFSSGDSKGKYKLACQFMNDEHWADHQSLSLSVRAHSLPDLRSAIYSQLGQYGLQCPTLDAGETGTSRCRDTNRRSRALDWITASTGASPSIGSKEAIRYMGLDQQNMSRCADGGLSWTTGRSK